MNAKDARRLSQKNLFGCLLELPNLRYAYEIDARIKRATLEGNFEIKTNCYSEEECKKICNYYNRKGYFTCVSMFDHDSCYVVIRW